MAVHTVGVPVVLYSGTVKETGVGSAFPVSGFIEGLLCVEVTAVGGTNPTLDLTIEVGPEADELYPSHTTITQITTTGKKIPTKLTNFGKWMRLAWTLGGTETPYFTFVAKFIGKT